MTRMPLKCGGRQTGFSRNGPGSTGYQQGCKRPQPLPHTTHTKLTHRSHRSHESLQSWHERACSGPWGKEAFLQHTTKSTNCDIRVHFLFIKRMKTQTAGRQSKFVVIKDLTTRIHAVTLQINKKDAHPNWVVFKHPNFESTQKTWAGTSQKRVLRKVQKYAGRGDEECKSRPEFHFVLHRLCWHT